MSWLEVNLVVPRSQAENVSEELEYAGALAVSLQNSGDGQVMEPGVDETPLWKTVRVTGLFAENADRQQLQLQLLSLGLVQSPGQVHFSELADQQWERSWMDRFQPMQFGRRLWIYPGNIEPPHNDDIIVRLDPGLAFGTGTHTTTALCLCWLDGTVLEGETVVDYGCGSGILAVAAALLGANRVIAVDNDPQALSVTRENASQNGVAAKIETVAPEAFDTSGANLVLANILSGPLIDLAPVLTGCLTDGGQLVLSGILENQADRVREAYSTAVGWKDLSIEDGWVRLSGIKK